MPAIIRPSSSCLTIITSIFIALLCMLQAATGHGQTLTTQAEVDAFNRNDVTGTLRIRSGAADPIRNIDALSNLTQLTGTLIIEQNDQLQNIDGLINLTDIAGELTIAFNPLLNDIGGLASLTAITGTLEIRGNRGLTQIDALSNLTDIAGSLILFDNNALTNIDVLANLTDIAGTLRIFENDALTNIDGLANLVNISGTLRITSNIALTNIDPLANLTDIVGSLTIGGNDALINIDGLANLVDISGILEIINNGALTNIDALSNLTDIIGALRITSNIALTNIDGLANLTEISGTLNIYENDVLPNIGGLSSLTDISGTLSIEWNKALSNIDGLANLLDIAGSLNIFANDALTNIDGLANLVDIAGSLNIFANDALTNINGLANLVDISGTLVIMNNGALTNIDALSNLTDIMGALRISSNIALTNIDGLANLNNISGTLRIEGNRFLTNIDGLANLNDIIGDLTIMSNASLTDCCGLSPVLSRPGGISGLLSLFFNPFACGSVEEVLTTCRLTIQAVAQQPCIGVDNGGFDIVVAGYDTIPLYYSWTRISDGATGTGWSTQSPFFIDGLGDGIYDITVWTPTPRDTFTLDSLLLEAQVGTAFEVFEVRTTNSSNGLNNGSIIAQYQGGQPPYLISWSGTATGSRSGVLTDSFVISGLTFGAYDIIITDDLNRQVIISITLLDEVVPVIPCEEPLDIVILNDVSGSVSPVEYAESKVFFIDFLRAANIGNAADDSRAAMVEWSSTGEHTLVIPMTGNMSTLESYLSSNRSFEGGTDPLSALTYGEAYLDQVARPDAERVLILSTDGSGGQISPALVALADEYKAAGYHIITVAFDRAYSDPNTRNILRRVASIDLLAPGAPAYADLDQNLAEQIVNTYLCPIDPGSSATAFFNRDGAISILDLALVGNCPFPSAVEVTFALSASRELALPSGTPVTFYHNHPLEVGAIPIRTWVLPCAIAVGTSDTFTISLPITSATHLYALLNDDARLGTPFSWPVTEIEEIAFANNVADTLICVGSEALVQAYKYALNPYPICDTTITYTIDICNSSTTDAFDVEVQDEVPIGFNLLYTTISDGDCAIDQGGRYDIPAGCCFSLQMTYDVATADPGFYLDQDVLLGGPTNQVYVDFDGASTSREDVIISDSVDCLSTEIRLRKQVSVDTSCADRFLTYTFYIDNETSTPLSNLVFSDVLASPGSWVFRPYDVRGMRVTRYDIDGADLEVIVDEVLPDTIAQFSVDVFIEQVDQLIVMDNSASLDQVPDLTDGSLTSLQSNTVQTVIIPAPSITFADTIYVAEGDSAVLLEAEVIPSGLIAWTSDGDGVFSDSMSSSTQYVFGSQDLMDSLLSLFISVVGDCDEMGQQVFVVREDADTCSLIFSQFNIADCDDNSTSDDPSDDTFELTFSIATQGSASSQTYTVISDQDSYGPYSYGVPQSITLPADGSQIALQFIDEMDAVCRIDTVVSALACSADCDLSVQVDITDASCLDVADAVVSFEVTSTSSTSFDYRFDQLDSGTVEGGRQVLEGLSAGSYQLTIQDGDNDDCQIERMVEVGAQEDITLDVTPDTSVTPGDTVQIQSASNRPLEQLSWSWSPNDDLDCTDCPDPMARPQSSTVYTATATDTAGCFAMASLTIVVVENSPIYIPNAFSPNGDGINDAFMLYNGAAIAEVVAFRIYNRWGGLVHERYGVDLQSQNTDLLAWDGRVDGQEASEGSYAYHVVVRTQAGIEATFTGDVLLLR